VADLTEADARKAILAAKIAMIAVMVSALVLLIDNRLKKFIIEEGQRAAGLLEQAKILAQEAQRGQPRSDSPGAGGSDPVGAADGVGDDAGAGADVAHSANGRAAAPAGRKAGTGGGTRGDGRRAGGAA
jgi:hypothetical protein